MASESLRLCSADQLPINDALLRLIRKTNKLSDSRRSHKKQRNEEAAMCEVCESKATVYCAPCGQDLCAEHDGSAHAAAELSSHSRVPLKCKAALFKALTGGDVFKQTASNCKANIQGALGEIAAVGTELAKSKKGHMGESADNERAISQLQPIHLDSGLNVICLLCGCSCMQLVESQPAVHHRVALSDGQADRSHASADSGECSKPRRSPCKRRLTMHFLIIVESISQI